MAVKAGRITVTDQPTLLSALEADTLPGQSLAVVVLTGSIDVGGSAVASGGGWPLAVGVPTSMDLEQGEGAYGICAAGQTASVAVLHTGV